MEKGNKHLRFTVVCTHFRGRHKNKRGAVFCAQMSRVCVPVFISVDSPDHSNGDANSCQYDRAHWEGICSDREPVEGWRGHTQILKNTGLEGLKLVCQDVIRWGKLEKELHFPQWLASTGEVSMAASKRNKTLLHIRLAKLFIISYCGRRNNSHNWLDTHHKRTIRTWLFRNQLFLTPHQNSWTRPRPMPGRIWQ